MINQTLDITLRLAIQLLPFLLLVSVDDDMDGEPELSESYVVWLDPDGGVADVPGPTNTTVGLVVSNAYETNHGWIIDLSLKSSRENVQILVPTSGCSITGANGNVKVTARLIETWNRKTQVNCSM